MPLRLSFSLDELAQLYTQGFVAPEPYGSPEHAGLAAVLDHIALTARRACAHEIERYDHRSLYEFTAELDYACRRGAEAAAQGSDTPSESD